MAARLTPWGLRVHLGRRGSFLLIVGIGEFVWGLQFMLDPSPNTSGLALLTDVAPLRVWSWLWLLGGAAAIVAGFVRIGRDWAGFAAALAPPIVWLGAHFSAAFAGDYSRGLWIATYYASIHVGVVLWASATPEFGVPGRAEPPGGGRGGNGEGTDA